MKVDFFIRFLGLVFWNSIHLEVASDSFCFLINSSWLLVFILYVFFIILSGFNLNNNINLMTLLLAVDCESEIDVCFQE